MTTDDTRPQRHLAAALDALDAQDIGAARTTIVLATVALERERARHAALVAAAREVVDERPMDWTVPSLHPDHIEVHENAFDRLMDAIDVLERALDGESR